MNFKLTDKKLIVLALVALGLETSLFFSNFHFLYQTPQVAAHLQQIANVQSVGNKARARSTFQLNWAELKVGQVLYEGDEVATGENSQLSIEFTDGQLVKLGANSLLELKRIRTTSGRSFNLTLLRGKLDVSQTEVKKSQLEIQVGSQKLIANGSTSLKVESSASGDPTIQISEGQVQINNPLNISNFAQLKPPRIRRPTNESTIELSSALNSVSLQWEQVEANLGETTIEVSKDRLFSQLLMRKITGGANLIEFHPSHKGTYFWRITRKLGIRQIASEVASFEVIRRMSAPILSRPKVESGSLPQIKHISPPSLQTPVIRYRDQSGLGAKFLSWFIPSAEADELDALYSVELNWQKIDEANSYVIEIAVDPAFKNLSLEQTVRSTSFKWKTDAAGSYFWRVAAVDADGDRGPYSEYSAFRILAQKNVEGDETTYESYSLFDDYTRGRNLLSMALGPEYSSYYFNDTFAQSGVKYSPLGVTYRTYTVLNITGSYDYVLSPFWSFHSSLRVVKNYMDPFDYEQSGGQTFVSDGSKKSTTDVFLGMERRFFKPRSYLGVEGGVRAYFAGIPGNLKPTQSQSMVGSTVGQYFAYGFFGFYLFGSYDWLLGSRFDLNLKLGGSALTSGESSRVSQISLLQVRKRISDTVGFGVKFTEELANYNLRGDQISGDAHSLTLYPEFFAEVKF